jgi:hypothetical protein
VTAQANADVVATAHRIFITTGTASLGSGDNVAFQQSNNAFCQSAASAAGLLGTWLGVYSTGFIRKNNGVPLMLQGPVLNFDGEEVKAFNAAATAPITTDETGAALPGNVSAWTSECAFDFLANKNVAGHGNALSLFLGKIDCVGSKRRICISE